MKKYEFDTGAIHDDFVKESSSRDGHVPIYDCASFSYDDAETIAEVFQGKKFGYNYSRISNPTVTALERRLNFLEDGIGAIATSSGMAAISTVAFALVQSGDKIIASKGLFSSTYHLFKDFFAKFNVHCEFVDPLNLEEIRNAVDESTRMIFIETIGNPSINVPDFEEISKIAKDNNVPLVVDSTLTTPYLFKAKEYGADIVVHSITKFLTGNGTSIGGAIIDTGNFSWNKCKSKEVKDMSKKAGEFAFLVSARKNNFQLTGPCMSPFNAHQHILGVETLSIRMDKHCNNAMELAKYLSENEKVSSVNYPGLKDSPNNKLASKQFQNKFGGLLTFRLDSKESCFKLVSKLKLLRNQTNLGDARTLIIHLASTIFCNYSDEELISSGIDDTYLRVSVGLENIDDIKRDFQNAFKEI